MGLPRPWDSGLVSVKNQMKTEDANDHRLQRLLGKKYGEDQQFNYHLVLHGR